MSVRFAPSPTGAFHIGNFRTAWISWAWARALALPWVVRFEDIDKPRVVVGSQERQLSEMAELGLRPDEILLQSQKNEVHFRLFERAVAMEVVYPCVCSRKEVLQTLASAPHGPQALYSGQCRRGADISKASQLAWRFRAPDASGQQDFIIARTDAGSSSASFVPAYHWACAIDDWEENHKLLVRAQDLASATPIQRLIQAWLRGNHTRSYPAVFHTSLLTANDGARLEKRTQGVTFCELRMSPRELLQRFELSFSANAREFAEGRVWGEARATITLAELGL